MIQEVSSRQHRRGKTVGLQPEPTRPTRPRAERQAKRLELLQAEERKRNKPVDCHWATSSSHHHHLVIGQFQRRGRQPSNTCVWRNILGHLRCTQDDHHWVTSAGMTRCSRLLRSVDGCVHRNPPSTSCPAFDPEKCRLSAAHRRYDRRRAICGETRLPRARMYQEVAGAEGLERQSPGYTPARHKK